MLDVSQSSRSQPCSADDRTGFPSLTEEESLQILEFLGCDRVSVSFLAAAHNPDETAWNHVSVVNPGTDLAATSKSCSIEVEGASVFVGVSFIPDRNEWFGKVEVNPGRVGDPDGWGSKGFGHALPAIAAAVDAAAESLVCPAVAGVGEMRVKRLDVCRDFEVPRPEFFIRGLGPVNRPYARRNLVHFDPQRRGAQTLMVGVKAGVVRLYDKHAETGGQAPEGTLRWEVQMRSDWCKRYGEVVTVNDLNDPMKVASLAKNRWEWSAMGVEVSARQRVIEEVQRSELSPREQVSYLGWLTLQAEGVASPMSQTTLAKYRRLTRHLGVVMGPAELDRATQFSARLDFDTGREVLSA